MDERYEIAIRRNNKYVKIYIGRLIDTKYTMQIGAVETGKKKKERQRMSGSY